MGEGKPARNPRNESITAIAFAHGRVLVAGISNEAFSSTLRAIRVLFSTVDRGAGEENDLGAHGKFRTRAPVRTFVPYKVGGESLLRAAYRCTPRVQFARDDLKPGAKITGKTLAEFANGHRPLDIIVYAKDEKDFRHMANNSRGVIKGAGEQITGASSIHAKVAETEGLKGEKFEWAGITQHDRLDGKFVFTVRVGPNQLRRAGRHGRGPPMAGTWGACPKTGFVSSRGLRSPAAGVTAPSLARPGRRPRFCISVCGPTRRRRRPRYCPGFRRPRYCPRTSSIFTCNSGRR